MDKLVNGKLVALTPEDVSQRAAYIEAEAVEFAATGYILQRKSEYPPAADYLDGIVKGDSAQVNAYIADCLAVKAKYPKGDQ